jgi:hypothetical protein
VEDDEIEGSALVRSETILQLKGFSVNNYRNCRKGTNCSQQ